MRHERREGRKGLEVCNCSTDEGRPLGTGLQEQVPNQAVMLAAVEALMKRLKLAMNVRRRLRLQTRCCRVPEESMTFLGYRIGCNYRPGTGAAYIGTHPSRILRRS